MIAELMGQPLLLRPHEIRDLTDCQIIDYYHHPRDKDGRVIRRGWEPTRELTPEESRAMMESIARAYGLEIPADGK